MDGLSPRDGSLNDTEAPPRLPLDPAVLDPLDPAVLDPEMAAELASLFLGDLPEAVRTWRAEADADLARLERALSGADPESARRAAHRIRGAATGFAAAEVTRLAASAERLARDGVLPTAAHSRQLGEAVERAHVALLALLSR